MKKIIEILFLLAIIPLSSIAQTDSLPPYKKFPEPPPFKLLLTDSASWYSKDNLPPKKQVLIMLFSPECEHCQHEIEEIIAHIDEFRKIHIVMSTTLPFEAMKEFYIKYGLGRFDNITVGKDVSYLLPVFYNVRFLPYLALYDKKGELIEGIEGSLPVERLLDKFKQ